MRGLHDAAFFAGRRGDNRSTSLAVAVGAPLPTRYRALTALPTNLLSRHDQLTWRARFIPARFHGGRGYARALSPLPLAGEGGRSERSEDRPGEGASLLPQAGREPALGLDPRVGEHSERVRGLPKTD